MKSIIFSSSSSSDEDEMEVIPEKRGDIGCVTLYKDREASGAHEHAVMRIKNYYYYSLELKIIYHNRNVNYNYSMGYLCFNLIR